jgi:hypothetical protein
MGPCLSRVPFVPIVQVVQVVQAPTSFLPRVAGEDEGGGLNDWNFLNDLNRFTAYTMNPYSLPAFSQTILWRTSGDR